MNIRGRFSKQQEQENISRKQLGELLESRSFVTGDIIPDLGEDILVRIYEKEISTGLSFYIQIKSVGNIEKHILKSGDISYSFESKDLDHWSAQAPTVILVVWDVNRRQGWWMWINHAIQYLEKNNPNWKQIEKPNIHIPINNVLNEGGLSNIRFLLADLYYPIISKDKPLTINAKFSFPKTLKGKEKFDELKRHFAAGDEVEIDGQNIESFDFPDWWKRLYGDIEPRSIHLKLGTIRSEVAQPTQVEFISQTNNERIPYVKLWTVKKGNEEITLSNDQQNIPIKISIVLNKINSQYHLRIKANTSNLNCTQVLQILKIQKILVDGGSIRLTMHDSGETITLPIPSNSFPSPDQITMDFVNNICFIQDALKVKINFQEDGSFTQKDINDTNELVSVIERGCYKQNGLIFSVDLRKPGIEKIIDVIHEGSPVYFQIGYSESYVEILSTRIELGPFIQKIKGYLDLSLVEIRSWFANAKDDDSLLVRLNEVELFEEFENWKK